MAEGIHLTPIGDGNVLLEPGEGLDPSNPEALVAPVLEFLQNNQAQRLVYDLKIAQAVSASQQSQLLTSSFEITAAPMPGHTPFSTCRVWASGSAGSPNGTMPTSCRRHAPWT